VTVSTGALFIRLADAPALVVAFWRAGLAALLILPFGARTLVHELRAVTWRERLAGVTSGLFLAVHFAAWITSLEYTSVAASTVIVSSTPMWVALFAPLFTRDVVGRATVQGIALSVIGAAVIGWGDLGVSREAIFGDLLALAGAITAALYVLAGRRLRPRVGLVTYTFVAYGSAAAFTLLAVLVCGLSLVGFEPASFGWIAALALGPQLLGHTSYNYALRWVSAALVSVTMLFEPIGATVLAWLFLGESPSAATLAGGALILAGISRVAWGERTRGFSGEE
jgi:drug/metabolite transporter (DMT)-like permease